MPNAIVSDLIKRLERLERKVDSHLLEGGVIKTNLKFNTWLTCAIAVIILTVALRDLWK